MSSIPSNELVNTTPSVLAAGGAGLQFNGMVLTNSTRVPIGAIETFDDDTAVDDYFGPTSHQATFAGDYFEGPETATQTPQALKYVQYPLSAVSAYLRGGNFSAVTLATLQSFNGTLAVTIDGAPFTASINLSAATSNSNAAEIIANDLGIDGVQVATFTGSIAATVLTVSAVATGALGAGDVVAGVSVVSGTYITAQLTGTAGGVGTYSVSASQTVGSEAMTANAPGCYYDSIAQAFVINSGTTGAGSTLAFATGALAADLLLTSATGAVLSQGAAATTPAAFMGSLIQQDTNWVSFTTDFDPDGGSGNVQKQAFAAWNTTQSNRYAYICWDTDVTPTESVPATGSLGYILAQNGNSGTSLNWESGDQYLAAFVMGTIASINFGQTIGRITFAFKSQAGLAAGVSTPTAAQNLGGNPQQPGNYGNGYNFYGAYATAGQGNIWYQRGFVTGPFQWLDSYVNQIWLLNQMQIALLTAFGSLNALPFNSVGQTIIQQVLKPAILAGLSFGAYGPGTLSAAQAATINQQAGANIANAISAQGWYLQFAQASAAVKNARGPQQITFWYFDQGSVQSINLNSVAIPA